MAGVNNKSMKWICEWVEDMMLNFPQSYDFISRNFGYTREVRKRLFPGEITMEDTTKTNELIERVTNSPGSRKHHFYHEPGFEGIQDGLNVMNDSYIRPHSRSTDELIKLNTGKVASLSFDRHGNVRKKRILTMEDQFTVIPGNTYHTIVPIQPVSSIWIRVKGPYNYKTSREDPSWAPEEGKEGAAGYYNKLKIISFNCTQY